MTALVASQATAQMQPPPTLGAPLNQLPASQVTSSPPVTLSEQEKETLLTNVKELIAKSRKAIVDNQAPPAVKNYAQAMAMAGQMPEVAESLQQVREELMKRGIKATQLETAVRAQQAALTASNSVQPPALMTPSNGAAAIPSAPTLLANGTPPANAPYNPLRDEAAALAAQAKLALARGDLQGSRQFINQANALQVADDAFGPGQLRPWQVQVDLERAEKSASSSATYQQAMNQGNPVQTASNEVVAPGNPVTPSVFQPSTDNTLVAPASSERTLAIQPPSDANGETLFKQGMDALTAGNRDDAVKLFSQAWKFQDRMEPQMRSQLKDKLMLLQNNNGSPQPLRMEAEPVTALQDAGNDQNLMKQKLFREVTGEIAESERMVTDQPLQALDRLQMLRQRTSQSSVDGAYRKQMLAMIDKVLNNVQDYVDNNRPAIELAARNNQIQAQLAQDGSNRVRTDSEVHRMVEQFNDLMNKGMYAEAEIVAQKVGELAPDSEIYLMMYQKAKFKRRDEEYAEIKRNKEEGFVDQLNAVERSAEPYMNADKTPMQFVDAIEWGMLRDKRGQAKSDSSLTPAERVIREKLKEPVTVKFSGQPLSQAVETLSNMAGIVIMLSQDGLEAEGHTSEVPVNFDLKGSDIPLKSVLNLILKPLKLTYDVQDDVLLITSKKTLNRNRKPRVYGVKDLVLPIPNFVTDGSSGMAGALRSAYINQGQQLLVKASAQTATESMSVSPQFASLDPNMNVLGQANIPQLPGMLPGGMGGMGGNMGPGFGQNGFPMNGFGNNSPATGMFPPGGPIINGNPAAGLGGGGGANFQPLIRLIQSTIDGDWEADGGSDTIEAFQSNLSLVVGASQETHEAIAELLTSLRALQNLQVTIEVRFMTLSDNFFERIGVDFSIGIDNNADTIPPEDQGKSTTIGISSISPLTPTADLDVRFNQSSFTSAVPQFGIPDTSGGRFGLAILSDIEMFFLLEAAQGDSRTNVLQAPKVTMYDGQTATINDTAQRPFVTSLVPVVGDFAVAHQPIIVVLSEGTNLSVQSVVMPDKRFVRLTMVPMFTRVSDADRTFTFSGSRTTRSGSTILDPDGNPTDTRDDEEQTTVGTTVQLPTFAVTSVSTTVTVPDGGTILLGGIKRLREGRTERGVPLLNKLPYINRLFKNVGIGRETNTLMFTVTPRIIIPEEEEQRVLGTAAP